jgi:hypothetical protein
VVCLGDQLRGGDQAATLAGVRSVALAFRFVPAVPLERSSGAPILVGGFTVGAVTWRLPRRLDAWLPHVNIEGSAARALAEPEG